MSGGSSSAKSVRAPSRSPRRRRASASTSLSWPSLASSACTIGGWPLAWRGPPRMAPPPLAWRPPTVAKALLSQRPYCRKGPTVAKAQKGEARIWRAMPAP
eukprot:405150-Prymnesium_polylepis.1